MFLSSTFSFTNVNGSDTENSSPKQDSKIKSQSLFSGKLFRKKTLKNDEEITEIKALVIGNVDVGKSLFISKLTVYIFFNIYFSLLMKSWIKL